MQPIYAIILYGCLMVGVYLVVDAIAGFLRRAGGADDEAVERRLSTQAGVRIQSGAHVNVIRPKGGLSEAWQEYIPFYLRFLPLSIPFAPVIGIGSVILYLSRARKKRRGKFEEQLPDAIDLIVRSLKIGHPLSGAMSVVGRELPTPICTEFATAFEEVTYGQDIPAAFAKMAERIKLQDLGYLAMAIQIQQESGGNLVESLSKLSSVIRSRFRMFRKVKSLTAEGRFSAWFLSIFPFTLIFIIQFIKPDHYTQVMDVPVFPYLVAATFVLLGINIIAMRIITNLKV